ncbi:uncharacterized protein LOC133774497 [Lepus europaeus]|uniref:uncharacterized protein LOC133774497 n=1 Tax=Lepus europaeus TaxID=9983 RepID=UPI002B4A56C5|nr:uncharacterized protein LOC133774497 [Lepus europaeus]
MLGDLTTEKGKRKEKEKAGTRLHEQGSPCGDPGEAAVLPTWTQARLYLHSSPGSRHFPTGLGPVWLTAHHLPELPDNRVGRLNSKHSTGSSFRTEQETKLEEESVVTRARPRRQDGGTPHSICSFLASPPELDPGASHEICSGSYLLHLKPVWLHPEILLSGPEETSLPSIFFDISDNPRDVITCSRTQLLYKFSQDSREGKAEHTKGPWSLFCLLQASREGQWGTSPQHPPSAADRTCYSPSWECSALTTGRKH